MLSFLNLWDIEDYLISNMIFCKKKFEKNWKREEGMENEEKMRESVEEMINERIEEMKEGERREEKMIIEDYKMMGMKKVEEF